MSELSASGPHRRLPGLQRTVNCRDRPLHLHEYTSVGQSVSPASLIKKLSLPGGSYITNTFDSVARLLSTSLKNSSNTVLNSHAYVYDLGGERTKQTFKDGNYLDYTYDALGNLTSKTDRKGRTINYVYDADVTGRFCTKWNERESTWRKSGHADEEVQARANRDDAAAN